MPTGIPGENHKMRGETNMAGAVERYKKGVADFCNNTFGTSDLEACRDSMSDEYSAPWK